MKSSVRVKLLLFIFLVSLYILTTAGYPTTSMCSSMFLSALSLVEEGDLALDSPTLETGVGKDGRYYIYEGLAVILVVAVFILFTKFIGVFPQGIFMVNHLLTALACVILFLIGRELKFSKKTSVLLALIYGVGTMAWVHSRYLMPEPLTTVVYLMAFLFLLRFNRTGKVKELFLCGCFTGLALLVRPDAPLFMLGIGIGVCGVLYRRYRGNEMGKRILLRDIVFFAIPILFFFALYVYYNYIRFGNIFELGYSTKAQIDGSTGKSDGGFKISSISHTLLGFAGMWIIPCRSMFFINPVLIFVLWALKGFWKKYRFESIVIGIIFILHVLLYTNRGPVGFPGSSAWGIRYMVPVTAFMVVVMGVFVERIVSNHRRSSLFKIFLIVFLVSILFQIIGNGMSYHATQLMLEQNLPAEDKKWVVRKTMNLDPRWNLLTQNIKWLLTGRTDLMYYNYLNREQVNLQKYMWEKGVPGWVGASFVIFLLTLSVSGYLLGRWLLKPAVSPQQRGRTLKKKKKRKR